MSSATKPVEQKARELLAAELPGFLGYDVRDGNEILPFGNDRDDEWVRVALRTIIAVLNTDGERIRREAFEEAAKVADNLDAGVVAYHIRSLSTPSKAVG